MTSPSLVNLGITSIGPWRSLLGESPMWHPSQQVLYWCDIVGCTLHQFNPQNGHHTQWVFHTDVACCAAMADNTLLLALRDGLWQFNPQTNARKLLVKAPYNTQTERFNDGKCDPTGRFWTGTMHPDGQGGLYCYTQGLLTLKHTGIHISNGLAWADNGQTMYWADTPTHTVQTFTQEGDTLSQPNLWASFDADVNPYPGRPDGAAVDADGCYWVAMYEGSQILRLSPAGQVVQTIPLPVSCPTMVCFGGENLKTLFITTASENRPAEELASQPLAGCVLATTVDVPGLPSVLFAG